VVIRVLIVDNSLAYCKQLSELMSVDSKIHVIGFAHNGQKALELAHATKPDIITMDINIPIVDGTAAVRNIMEAITPPLLMLSKNATQASNIMLEALDHMYGKFDSLSAKTNRQQQLCQRLQDLAKHSQKPALFSPETKKKSQQSHSFAEPLDAHCKVHAKQAESSTVQGMPIAITKAGLAEHIFDINDLSAHLSEFI